MKKKTLVMLLCTAMVITTAAFGTMAYLTDTSTVTNRFTIGNVSIDVDESVVTLGGEPVDADGDGVTDRTSPDPTTNEEGNTYHLIPGQTYIKDPTLTVKASSEESYVRMLVTITHIDKVRGVLGEDFMPEQYVTGWDSTIWPFVSVAPGTETVTDPITQQQSTIQTAVYEFRYHTTVAGIDANGAAADNRLEALFGSFTVPGELTGEQLEQLQLVEIRVVGHAIQTEGFADVDTAWAAFPAPVATISIPQDQQGDSAAGV